MSERCGCCAGTEWITPVSIANRPGLDQLSYRVGTHATFLETMKARLSSLAIRPDVASETRPSPAIRPLGKLRTRSADDPAIALLDAWAIVADVLTFYQERIANEGYLRTATERRSVLELARLIGYAPKPGVAASVYLAYTIEATFKDPAPIPAGSRAQSVPGPGETMQSFETADALVARAAWNNLAPRLTRPQNITLENAFSLQTLYFEGTETSLKPNDPLLLVLGNGDKEQLLRRVATVTPDAERRRTKVTLQELDLTALAKEIKEGATRFLASQFFARMRRIAERYLATQTLALTPQEVRLEPLLTFTELLKGALQPEKLQQDQVVNNATQLIGLFAARLPELWSPTQADGSQWSFRAAAWLRGLGEELKQQLLELPDLLREEAQKLPNFDQNLTTIRAQPDAPPLGSVGSLTSLIPSLSRPPAPQYATSRSLPRDVRQLLSVNSDLTTQALTTLLPHLTPSDLYDAWANAPVTPPVAAKVYAFRVTASLFGSSTPKRVMGLSRGQITATGEWPIIEREQDGKPVRPTGQVAGPIIRHETDKELYLDAVYDKIVPDSWLVVDSSAVAGHRLLEGTVNGAMPAETVTITPPVIATVSRADAPFARGDYGVSGKATRIVLGSPAEDAPVRRWGVFDTADPPSAPANDASDFRLIRSTVVHAQSELLVLAEEPIEEPICGDRIELGGLYDGLSSGQWIVVAGERADVYDGNGVPIEGVRAAELAMIANVHQDVQATLPGDEVHSTLVLAKPLAYCYQRDTVTIYGNVVKATHGETRTETLGSGTAAPMQQFTLKQPPLTYVSAPTPSGIESTLAVRVNDLLWHETDSLATLGPTDRRIVTRTDDAGVMTVIFGDGERGARPPTGIENIKSVYRNGIGKAGNVKAGQISLLATRPLGAKEVVNPLRASGGADPESRDRARRNAPLAVLALDRLVSTSDYADFARTFAGIGKAEAMRVPDRGRQIVRVTIAGEDDIPIDPDSDLYRNLRQALRDFGDPSQPFELELRELVVPVLSTQVQVLPDYLWEAVEPKLRAALLEAFGFERRELGQSLFLSELVTVMQRVPGVDYVEVDLLDGLSETEVTDPSTLASKLQQLADDKVPNRVVRASPNQLIFFAANLPDTLVLNVMKAEARP